MVEVQHSASCRNPVIEDLLACQVENAQGDIFTAGIFYVQDASGRVWIYLNEAFGSQFRDANRMNIDIFFFHHGVLAIIVTNSQGNVVEAYNSPGNGLRSLQHGCGRCSVLEGP